MECTNCSKRLEHLERHLRRNSSVLKGALAALGVLAFLGWDSPDKEIACEKLTIHRQNQAGGVEMGVGENGQHYILVRADDGHAKIRMSLNEKGEPAIALSTSTSESVLRTTVTEEGNVKVQYWAPDRNSGWVIDGRSDGSSNIALIREKATRISINSKQDDSAAVQIFDTRERSVAHLRFKDGHSGFDLLDAAGPTWFSVVAGKNAMSPVVLLGDPSARHLLLQSEEGRNALELHGNADETLNAWPPR